MKQKQKTIIIAAAVIALIIAVVSGTDWGKNLFNFRDGKEKSAETGTPDPRLNDVKIKEVPVSREEKNEINEKAKPSE